ncbi:major facilitator superfamily domain-containing protein [Elsinoe ampelina]|uniref:Major facilitator superfamily domain-containing protein n=1 Tax=Elsinoe ampelina TaxID=302913 RepID=A0A6A6GPP1_9PEZI|nr:major facilitator superfamily domain-containing protein [Elsinoe ampelina]
MGEKADEHTGSVSDSTMVDLEKAVEAPSSQANTSGETTLDWDDPANKQNPTHWPLWIKIIHTFIPCCLSFTITFATSVTVPATRILAQDFDLSRTYSLLPLTLYTLGIGFGPLFIAPLSEAFGRKWIYISTHLVFMLFILGAALSPTFSGVLACRFLAGFLGSAGVAVGAGTATEIWQHPSSRGISALLFILGPFLGPTLGPLAGAYVLAGHDNNWRWTQYTILVLSLPIWCGLIWMRETHKATILKGAVKMPAKQILQLIKGATIRPTKMLFTETIVASLTLYTAYAYAMIFSFFTSVSYVLPLYYGFDGRQVGLSLLAVIIGYLLASLLYGIFDKTLYVKAAARSPDGMAAPEHRLYSGLVGSVLIPASLFWYAWEARQGGDWARLVAAGIPFGLGSFSLFLSAITYQADVYKAGAAASALAANGTLRYTLGAVFPLFTVQMYEKLGVQWAGSLFAFLSLVLLPIPWLLFKYGPKLRAMDRRF